MEGQDTKKQRSSYHLSMRKNGWIITSENPGCPLNFAYKVRGEDGEFYTGEFSLDPKEEVIRLKSDIISSDGKTKEGFSIIQPLSRNSNPLMDIDYRSETDKPLVESPSNKLQETESETKPTSKEIERFRFSELEPYFKIIKSHDERYFSMLQQLLGEESRIEYDRILSHFRTPLKIRKANQLLSDLENMESKPVENVGDAHIFNDKKVFQKIEEAKKLFSAEKYIRRLLDTGNLSPTKNRLTREEAFDEFTDAGERRGFSKIFNKLSEGNLVERKREDDETTYVLDESLVS
jgi:hypothetical protein